MNQLPTFISNVRFVLFTLRHGTPRLACIKLFPTNSDRLQGFIRQTLINLIIDHISTHTRDQKKILVYVIILPKEIFGNFRSHAMSRYNSWNNFIQRGRYYTSSISRASRESDLPHIEYQICLRANIAACILPYASLSLRRLKSYECNVTSFQICKFHSNMIVSFTDKLFCSIKHVKIL